MTKNNFACAFYFRLVVKSRKEELIYGRFMLTANRMRKQKKVGYILSSFVSAITGYKTQDCYDLLYFYQLPFGTRRIFTVVFVFPVRSSVTVSAVLLILPVLRSAVKRCLPSHQITNA